MTSERSAFSPVVKGGFTADNAKHRKLLRYLGDYLDTAFVGSGQLVDGAVGSGALAPGAVTDLAVGDVGVGKLTSGELKAFVQMKGAIEAGLLKFTEDGMVILDSAGAIQGRFPGDGSEPFLRGQFEALNLLVDGTGDRGFELRGPGHLMAAGSTMVMGGAATGTGTVGDPPAAPGLSMFWDKEALGEPMGRRGLHWDGTNTSWWTTKGSTVYENDNDVAHTQLRSFNVNGVHELYGAVRVGTRIYVLFEHTDGNMLLRTYSEATLANIQQRNVGFGIGVVHGKPCIGYDGTNIVICDLDGAGSSQKLRFHKYTLADEPAYVSSVTSSGAGNPSSFSQLDSISGFALAETLWWVVVDGIVHAFSTAGVYAADKMFWADSSIVGLTHDGTRFWGVASLSGEAVLVKFSNWTFTDADVKKYVAYTYVDDNGVASVGARPLAAGDFETKKSPTAKITLRRRAFLKASAAAVDTALTGITHVGWYFEDGATEPALDYVADTAVVNGVATQKTFESFTGGGAAPPAANTFTASAAGDFAEFTTADGNPLLRANGVPRCKLRKNVVNQSIADATITTVDFASLDSSEQTDAFIDVANDEIDIPFTGQYWVQAQARFAANGTGYRQCYLELWDGAAWDVEVLVFQGANDVSMPSISLPGVAQFGAYLNLVAGDRIRMRVAQASSAALNLIDWNLSFEYKGPSAV